MLELIRELPDNVVGILARGRVTNEECDNVLRPAMETTLRRHGKLRLYYEIGSRFPGAGWGDLDVAIDHLPQWERVAVVSDTAWVRQMVNALRFLIASEIRVFTTEEMQEGRTWIAASPSSEVATPVAAATARAEMLRPPGSPPPPAAPLRSRRSARPARRRLGRAAGGTRKAR